jgi:phytol kinase
MFITSFIVVFGLSYFQKYSLSINIFAIAFISTVFEQFSIFGIDNFIVPISAAFCFNYFITGL